MTKIIRTDKWQLLPDKYQLSILADTVIIYREYVRRLISVVNLHWKEIAAIEAKQRYVEKLFNTTKDNPSPQYAKFFGLGTKYYKFPSYLRRAAINDAIGHVSSFQTRYRDWQGGIRARRDARPPKLNTKCGVYPDLYKNQCIKIASDYSVAEIKVYKNKDWSWEEIKIGNLAHRHLLPKLKQLSPTLVVRNNQASLSVPYEIKREKIKATNKYCGVDLGINITAVCSIVDESGIVHARKFIHDGQALDKRDKHLARISRKARLTKKLHRGFAKIHYRKAANLNQNIACSTAKQIINFAIANGAKTVVIENLRKWKPKGRKRKSSLKQRFHGWVSSAIADRLEQLGEEMKIQIVSVYARGTSSFAYDGSGRVRRDNDNYAVSRFQNGKIYHADLNASYNIAARHIAYKLKLASKYGKLLTSQRRGHGCGVRLRSGGRDAWGFPRHFSRPLRCPSSSKPRNWVTLSSLWGDLGDTTTTAPQDA